MNFKVGQKVVCVDNKVTNPTGVYPSINEEVTIKGECPVFDGNYDIEEYQRDVNGKLQSFGGNRFKPLELDYEFVEDVLKQVQSQEQLTNLFKAIGDSYLNK